MLAEGTASLLVLFGEVRPSQYRFGFFSVPRTIPTLADLGALGSITRRGRSNPWIFGVAETGMAHDQKIKIEGRSPEDAGPVIYSLLCSFDPLAILGNAMLDFVPRLPLVVGGFIVSEARRDSHERLPALVELVGNVKV